MPSVRQPECRNAESYANTPPRLHYTLGPHAATSTSGFRGSRVHDPKSLALGNPECRDSDTPDPCHLSTLRSTVLIESGNCPSRFQCAWDSCLANPDSPMRDGSRSFVHLWLKPLAAPSRSDDPEPREPARSFQVTDLLPL
jgi:hypothetical protein